MIKKHHGRNELEIKISITVTSRIFVKFPFELLAHSILLDIDYSLIADNYSTSARFARISQIDDKALTPSEE